MNAQGVAVIIAAYNAEATIAGAVRSALAEPEVAEVVVMDDASSDATAQAARRAADGDPRLAVHVQPSNRGPAAARNRALELSSAPYVAVLDADDALLPGRFAQLFAVGEWDMAADNIVMCSDFAELAGKDMATAGALHATDGLSMVVSYRRFVLGNISDPNRARGELGFLKPVMSRAFLDRHDLRYDDSCWLGEDFLLYAQALALGARFRVLGRCGYAALVRPDSLSGGHSLEDLRRLHDRCETLTRLETLSIEDRLATRAHMRSLNRRIDHRHVLSVKRADGLVRGIAEAAKRPTAISDILRDRRARHRPIMATPRLLLDPVVFERRPELRQDSVVWLDS